MSLAEATAATSFEHTLIIYLANDILPQADLLLAFRGEFKKITGLDPVRYLGIAGAAFSGMLRKTGAKFDLITKECMPGDKPKQLMKLVNDNIRGGLSCAFIPHALANNPDCEAYDAAMPQIWLGSLDATNLYGWCMSQMLPVGGYTSIELPQDANAALSLFHSLLDAYSAEQDIGYMLEVDFEIAPEDHDCWDLAPVVRKQVLWEELSRRQQEVKWSAL
jgi:hypothetical protein